MAEIVQSIFAQVPWLKVFLAWALAAAVVILVLSPPAYFFVLPLMQRIRAELAVHLTLLRERHAQKSAKRKDAERELVEQYSADHLLRHVDPTSSRLWARTKAALLQPANQIQAQLAEVMGSMDGFTKALPRVHERIQVITDAMPRDFSLISSEPGLGQATGALRVARMALTVCGLLLVAIIMVNTGMLSQIVRDLGFIPPSFKFLNVPLFYILALLITCVEAGFGVIHGVLADVDISEERGKLRIGSTLATAGAVGVACVEGFFYSRIVPNRTETVTIPLIGFSLPQTDIFFIWGFLLVMVLFGLGLICFRMSAKVLRGTALTNLRKQMRTFTKETVQWSGALQRAQSIATSARAAVAGSAGTTTSTPIAAAAVEQFLLELRTLLQAPPQWVSIKEQPLGVPEVLHLARHALLWFLVATAASIIAASTGMINFTKLAPDMASPIVLALGQGALVAAAGFLMGWGETVVEGPDWEKVTASSWGRLFGMVLIGSVIVAYLFLAIPAYSAGIVIPWVSNLLVCLVVSAACYQLIPLLGVSAIWTRRALHLLVSLGERMYRCLIAVLLLLAVLLDHMVSILAGPFLALKRSRDAVSTLPNNPYQ